MHLHNVYFWLKNDLDGQELSTFEEGLRSLCLDPATKSGFYGRPASTDRDVIDNSYSYGLVLMFEDLAAHDRYQTGKVHDQFIAAHMSKWIRAVVYDIEVD